MATICQLHADLKYYLYMQPVDMRKQFHGLEGLVVEKFGRYLLPHEAFIFVGKTRTTAKILHREANGTTLYVRKLDQGRFQMPMLNDDMKTCDIEYRDFVGMVLGANWVKKSFYEAKSGMPQMPQSEPRECVRQ